MKNLRQKLESIGVCMAAAGWLMVIVQLAGWWRWRDVDEWVYRALDHGSPEQFGVLAYLVITLILLSCRE